MRRLVLATVLAAVVLLAVGGCRVLQGLGSGDDDTATSATPETPAAPVFPDASTTGVPEGVELAAYDGPCTIVEPTVLSRVDATSCPALVIQAADVVIEESLLPRVEATAAEEDPSFSVAISDSEVRAGAWIGGAIWGYRITARRVEVTGGQHSFHCNDHCVLEDSWLHDQHNPDGEAAHNNAFISNGGTDMVVRGNTLHCTALLNATGGGCTADLSLFGDFQPIRHVTVEGNLFKANDSSIPWCVYGGHSPGKPFPRATHIVFRDNVFERGDNDTCGVYGPVTSFQPDAEGNEWSRNTWDDGATLMP